MFFKMMWIRIRALFRRNAFETDMDKEFQFHLEMRIQENIHAGMTENDAREAALRRFGSIGLAKERGRDVRGAGFLDPLLQDLRYGLRSLRNNPGFTVVAIVALALGIGANTAVFSYMDAMFWRPLPLPEPERLVRFYGVAGNQRFDSFSYANYLDVRDHAKSFSGLAAHQATTVNLTSGQDPEKAEAELVTGNYFGVLGLRPQLGRLFSPDDDRVPGAHPVAVISHRLWIRRFGGDPNVIGKPLAINSHPFTIVGVLPSSFPGTFSAFGTDVWTPMMMHEEVRPRGIKITNRGWGWLHGTARLKPGVTRIQAQAEVSAIARQIAEQYPKLVDNGFDFNLVPATAMREEFAAIVSRLLLFLMAAASVVLLITCGNIASVLLARAMSRRGEIAVRQSLGASRARLVQQWTTESVLLAVLGGVAGLAVSMWFARAALKLAPAGFTAFSPDFRIDLRTAGFALAAAVIAGLLFGFFPILWVRTSNVARALKHEGGTTGAKTVRSRVYGGLVTAQIALCMILLITSGLLFRSIRESDAFNPGFNTTDLLIADLNLQRAGYKPEDRALFYSQLIERIRSLPGVRGVTTAAVVPLGGDREGAGVFIPGVTGPDGKPYVSVPNNVVGYDYFETMGIPIVSGRLFDKDDFRPEALPVAIIGEAMARQFWPGDAAVGKTVRFAPRGPDVEIVGVVRDIKYYDLLESPRPYIYRTFNQTVSGGGAGLIIRTTPNSKQMASVLKRELAAMDSNLAWDRIIDFSILRRSAFAPTQAMLAASSLFGAIALVITAIGLYGVISYSVNRRVAEIGVRIALGAHRADILRMVISEGLRFAFIGTVAGLLISLVVTRYLSAQLFGITPTDPATYIAITILVFAVAFAASYLPAQRATRIAPTLALKWG